MHFGPLSTHLIERLGTRKANGAGISADPTLTGRGLLFRRTFQEALGAAVSLPPTGWRPVSPALAPASGSFFRWFQLALAEALASRTFLPSVPRSSIAIGLCPQTAGFSLRFPHPRSAAGCPTYPVDLRSRSSQTTLLASGLNLPHVRSQRPRGQSPLRR